MSRSRFCPRCQQPIPDHTPDGVCPSCGSALGPAAETPRTQDTPPTPQGEFVLGPADPNLTASHQTATMRVETPAKKLGLAVPTIPNHTDFEFLGRGGMGVVFRAVQRPMDRAVAVKVMLRFSAEGPGTGRFLNEIRALAKLKHDGIVPIYDAGECSLGPYFTMELIDGKTLSQRMRERPLAADEAARVIAEAAEAVHAAHQQGVIHRDIKPSNIMLDRGGRVKVTDFGLAKHVGGEEETETGVVVGTPSYMSPEQADGNPEKVTKLADVYCLGSTLFHLATGHSPHQRTTPLATIRHKAIEPTPRPRNFAPDLCPTLEAIILRSMALAPGDRFPTAAALASDLRKWAAGEETDTKPLTRGQRVRRFLVRRRVPLATAVLLPVLVFAGIAVAKRELDPKRQMEAALARGEKVTLVGAVGFPKWSEWKTGDANLGRSVIEDGSPGFDALSGAMLTLVDDPMVDAYRFSVDLRHAIGDGTNDVYTGLFLGYETLPTNDGTRIDRYVTIEYSDIPTRGEVANPRLADLHALNVAEQLLVFRPERVGFAGSNHGKHRFTPTNAVMLRNDWRTLAVEVTPAGLAVYFGRDEAGQPRRVLARTAAEIEERVMGFNNPEQLGTTRVQNYRWTPRRPLGILASHSTIAFRNAVLEPLTPPP